MRPSLKEVKEYFKDAEKVYFGEYTYKDMIPCGFDIKTLYYDERTRGYYCKQALGVDVCSDILMYDDVTKSYATITKYKTATHYGDRPDVIDFNKKYDLNFNLGSAVKYLARAGKKSGESKESDLNKALDFINRELHV